MSEDKEITAAEYADSVYRKAGCSPNTDGRWTTHRDDFQAGLNARSQALEAAKIRYGMLNALCEKAESEASALRKQLSEAPYNELIQLRELAADNEKEIERALQMGRAQGFIAAREGEYSTGPSFGSTWVRVHFQYKDLADYLAQLETDKREGKDEQ